MFFELIAVFIAGFAGAGAMMLLNLLTGRRLPRWLVPLGAGAAMIAATVSSEYSWYGRTAGGLPDGVQVAQTRTASAPWRPWTYLVPMTDSFVAVDTVNMRANAQQAQLYLTNIHFFGRWKPVRSVEVMVDCATFRRADPALGDDSPPVWRDAGADDPIVKAVCEAA